MGSALLPSVQRGPVGSGRAKVGSRLASHWSPVPFSALVVGAARDVSKLDVKLRTPTPIGPPEAAADTWVSQTPRNPTEALLRCTLVKNRIGGHQGSSPTQTFSAVKQMAKGMEAIAHQNTLLMAENRNLRNANEALSKRRRAKKTRVRQGGILTTGDARDVLTQKEVDEQLEQERRQNPGGDRERPTMVRRCGTCGQPGHIARICQVEVAMSDVYSSDSFQSMFFVMVA